MELKAQGLKAYFKNLVSFCINSIRLDKITANSPSKSHILHSECVSAALCSVPILSFVRNRRGLLRVRPAWQLDLSAILCKVDHFIVKSEMEKAL